ncbi:hypothetical protein SteCoe_9436 [Stentor coeruleus]|uniref:RBR-type E3 ubiquitin transferase n=1 Tax=Stentor coeruleus TaxID=5963 RepID=A0A1R2CHQ0_9CILI|nr:hypothetical protein SteCoe_9436 [Stentor coeruleus]
MENISITLEVQLNRLSCIIARGCDEKDFDKIRQLLKSYHKYIKYADLKVTAQVKIFSSFCIICENIIRLKDTKKCIQLTCGHAACSANCIQQLVINSSGNDIDYFFYTFCPKCGTALDQNIIVEAFGGVEKFIEIQKRFDYERAPKYECPLCFTKDRIDNSITLMCNHRFCKRCIKTHAEILIKEKQVGKEGIKCPSCGDEIHIEIMKYILTHEEFSRYDEELFDSFAPNVGENDIYFRCRNESCEFAAIVPVGIKEIECKTCMKKYCPVCRDDVHAEITCQENYDKKLDKSLLDLALGQGWKQCPYCKNMCERISGCNFMKCLSSTCKGANNFCYLCGVGIKGYTHFKIEGPYGKVCNTMDGNKD